MVRAVNPGQEVVSTVQSGKRAPGGPVGPQSWAAPPPGLPQGLNSLGGGVVVGNPREKVSSSWMDPPFPRPRQPGFLPLTPWRRGQRMLGLCR